MGNCPSKYRWFCLGLTVFALPSDPRDSKDLANDESGSDGTETESGDSSEDSPTASTEAESSYTEHLNLNGCTKGVIKSPNLMHQETNSSNRKYSHKSMPLKEYGIPGPPSTQFSSVGANTFTEGDRQIDSHIHSQSVLSEDRLSVASHLYGNNAYPATNSVQNEHLAEVATLSGSNLSMDARVCRMPSRLRREIAASVNQKREKGKGNSKQKDEDVSIVQERSREKGDSEEPQKVNDDITEISDVSRQRDEIKDFILDFINKSGVTEARNLKFFDAAVVYDSKDYQAVVDFIFDVKVIVEARLHEEIRIELFDSVEFAQSKVLVVEDVIERCSVVFIYLTENCNQETFRLFCDEGIGITRLGLGMGGNPWTHERQWVIKPVHTLAPKHRRYKTPVGLVSLQGIDWFDKDSAYTRNKLVHVMEHAVKQRKRKEGQSSSTQIDSIQLEQEMLRSSQHQPRKETHAETRIGEHPVRSKQHFAHKPSLNEDAMSFQSQRNGSMDVFSNQRGTEQTFGYYSPYMQGPPQSIPGAYPSHVQGIQILTNPHVNQPYIQSNGQLLYYMNQSGQQQPYLVDKPFNQHGIPMQNPGNFIQQPYLHAHQMHEPSLPQVTPYNNQTQFQSQQGYLPYQQQVLNGHAPNVQSAGLYQPHPSPFQNTINNNHDRTTYIPNPQVTPNYQGQALHRQLPVNSTYPDAASISGDYMRDRRNDAPPESELSVVSHVTGKLIVNPNLSNDDIEVDDPSGRGEPDFRPRTSEKRRTSGHTQNDRQSVGSPRMRSQRVCSQNDSSSCSDDSDIDLPGLRGKPKKGKVLNIYGCKNVQLGSDNRVVEKKEHRHKRRSTRRKSSETEASVASGPNMNSLKLSEMQPTETIEVKRNALSHHASSTVHEDNLDMTCRAGETSSHIVSMPMETATLGILHNEDETRNYLGDIDSKIYHRRQQRRSQTQMADDNTSVPIVPHLMNCLDKEDHTEIQIPAECECRPEYNMQASMGNVSISENVSDSELFGGGEVFEQMKPNISPDLNVALGVNTENSEVKTYNREASFAFSNFRGKNKQSIMTNSVHADDNRNEEFDELD